MIFETVTLPEDPAVHILAVEETVCGKHTTKTIGLKASLDEIMGSLDDQDVGWHWCAKCINFMTGIPQKTFTTWKLSSEV